MLEQISEAARMSIPVLEVLLVEDNDAHVQLIRRALMPERDKYNLTIAGTLAEARKTLERASPHLMIADYLLPDGKGTELLPADPVRLTFPVSILTGHGDEKVATAAMKAGAIDYIVKSVEIFADMPHIIDRTLREWHHITRRRQAERMVKKLSQAIEQAGESILITDRDGIIEYVNPAFEKITGYCSEEVIGQTPRLLKSGSQDARFYEEMWDTISSGQVWEGKVIDRKKDGSLYPAKLTISPILGEFGDITHYTHFVGIHSDLTDLESIEQQFYQAQKMEAIGTLVGGIAHNFNNALAGMTGNLYLAKKKVQHIPDVAAKLATVEQLAFGAADMIQQLLTFARKGVVSRQEMPLTRLTREILKLLRASVPENIILQQDICTERLQIYGDASQIHQLLINLINNARDAVEGGESPCICVRLEAFHPDAAFIEAHTGCRDEMYAHLSIEDNGCGISEDHIEHLFEPFFTTKEVGKGTGLGLSMVFGTVKIHHGFVEVKSEEGRGSTFHIWLPLLQSKEVAHSPPRQEAVARGQGELILLVDDDLQLLETAREVLESIGYRVLTATNGRQAVEIFEASSESIGLCIFDIVMPCMGGDKAAESVRQIDPHAKIIFSTGYDDRLRSSMEGETVISKPFPIEEMSHLIRKHLNSGNS